MKIKTIKLPEAGLTAFLKDREMQSSDLEIAIVGATGAVGAVALELLADRGHPAEKVKLLASKRSHGKQIEYAGTMLTVQKATPESFDGVDVAFISASSEVSLALAPEAVKRGVLVIDDGSAYRMDPRVPLVVPEVNGADVEWHSGIISIPNCTTTPLVMALAALRSVGEITSVTASTYQSVTGTGAAARTELLDQSWMMLSDEVLPPPAQYPHRIAFNLLPQVDDFVEEGYTKEEMKMLNESRKILDDAQLRLAATCVRVPVEVSHCESVTVEFARPVSPSDARDAIAKFPGITLLDQPAESVYPMPSNSAEDQVMVGRVRRDLAHENGIVFWLAADNLRKGAALNALQIMDECLKRNCLHPNLAQPAESVLIRCRRTPQGNKIRSWFGRVRRETSHYENGASSSGSHADNRPQRHRPIRSKIWGAKGSSKFALQKNHGRMPKAKLASTRAYASADVTARSLKGQCALRRFVANRFPQLVRLIC